MASTQPLKNPLTPSCLAPSTGCVTMPVTPCTTPLTQYHQLHYSWSQVRHVMPTISNQTISYKLVGANPHQTRPARQYKSQQNRVNSQDDLQVKRMLKMQFKMAFKSQYSQQISRGNSDRRVPEIIVEWNATMYLIYSLFRWIKTLFQHGVTLSRGSQNTKTARST